MTRDAQASIEVRDLVVRYGTVAAVARRVASRSAPASTSRCSARRAAARRPRCGPSPGWSSRPPARSASAAQPVFAVAPRVNVPAERRGLSMVFQSYAIWPHMTRVRQRGLRPARAASVREAEVTERVREALDLVQLGDLGAPQRLQALRAASSSAWRWRAPSCSRPPCCSSTSRCRTSTPSCAPRCGSSCKELQRRLGITSVYVTHDLEEALAISDRIVVMRDGVIEQVGTPAEIYDRPRNTFVADFVGSANLIRGRRRPDLERDGLVVHRDRRAARSSTASPTAAAAGAEALLSVRTVHLRLVARAPGRRRQRVAGPDPAAASSRATSRSTTSTGTAGRSSCARRPRSRWPRATTVFVSVEPRHCVLLED